MVVLRGEVFCCRRCLCLSTLARRQGVGKELGIDFQILERIVDYCKEPRSLAEIAEHLGLSDRYKMKKKYIDPLLGRYLEMTLPETPNSPAQRYVMTEEGEAMV